MRPPIALLSLLIAIVLAHMSALGQPIQIVAVTNTADFQPGLPQKGSLASIFCTGLQGPAGIVTAPPQYPLPKQIIVAGSAVSVWINFTPAPILAIAFEDGYQQINVQVPWEAPQYPLFVQVFQGSNSAYLVDANPSVDLLAADPSIFKWNVFFVDQGYAIVQHASDYSAVAKQNPAHAGEFLIAYGLSLGPVDNPPASGNPAPFNPLSRDHVPASACTMFDSVEIGGASAVPTYVGLAPGIAGVYQVNFQLPAGIPSGDQQLKFLRRFLVSPVGQCVGSGMGEVGVGPYVSRPALIAVE